MERPVLRTERLTIRAITAEDWAAIGAIWEDFEASEFRVYDTPKCTEESDLRARIARWAEATASGNDHLFFAAEREGQVIGFCSFNAREEGHEVAYGFRRAAQRQGYASETLRALFEYLRTLGITKLTAGTAFRNLPSLALLRRLGFRLVGSERLSFRKDEEGSDLFFDGGIFELDLEKRK